MGARGPKSSAALAVVSPITDSRPSAPPELTEDEADEWRAIVNRLPVHWFPKETHALLAAMLKHWSTHRQLCKLIEAFDMSLLKATDVGLDSYGKLLVAREREGRAMAGLAVKLRLTPQSRYRPDVAARQAQSPLGYIGADGSIKSKPWEKHR